MQRADDTDLAACKLHTCTSVAHSESRRYSPPPQGSLSGMSCSLADALREPLRQRLSPTLSWPTHRQPLYTYMAAVMACLLTSSLCHLFGCCNKHTVSGPDMHCYAPL